MRIGGSDAEPLSGEPAAAAAAAADAVAVEFFFCDEVNEARPAPARCAGEAAELSCSETVSYPSDSSAMSSAHHQMSDCGEKR